MKTCAFTGHRPKGLGYPESDERCAALKEKLRSLIIRMIDEKGVTHFISSMAQGVDMYTAEIVLDAIKEASLRWQRGFFFLTVRKHLSVSFADSRTVAAKRFPVPGGPANRAASSKPARFFRRWRRFAGFPLKGSLPWRGGAAKGGGEVVELCLGHTSLYF